MPLAVAGLTAETPAANVEERCTPLEKLTTPRAGLKNNRISTLSPDAPRVLVDRTDARTVPLTGQTACGP
ncbi:MAG: hypothetical protein M0Z54_09680 [Thermaerobacter sp.]|nr:hypothetical protein [Thermaerobacter sp.]